MSRARRQQLVRVRRKGVGVVLPGRGAKFDWIGACLHHVLKWLYDCTVPPPEEATQYRDRYLVYQSQLHGKVGSYKLTILSTSFSQQQKM